MSTTTAISYNPPASVVFRTFLLWATTRVTTMIVSITMSEMGIRETHVVGVLRGDGRRLRGLKDVRDPHR